MLVPLPIALGVMYMSIFGTIFGTLVALGHFERWAVRRVTRPVVVCARCGNTMGGHVFNSHDRFHMPSFAGTLVTVRCFCWGEDRQSILQAFYWPWDIVIDSTHARLVLATWRPRWRLPFIWAWLGEWVPATVEGQRDAARRELVGTVIEKQV